MKEIKFFTTYYPIAKQVEQVFNIPALVVLSQAALESGWASSTPGNMFFGIKAKNWSGKKQLLTTTEYHTTNSVSYPEVISITKSGSKYKYKVKDYFRAYDTPLDSFLDYGRFLNENSRYSNAFKYTNPFKFAYEIFKAGYATSPNYYNSLVTIIAKLKIMENKKTLAIAIAILVIVTAILTVYKTVKFDV